MSAGRIPVLTFAGWFVAGAVLSALVTHKVDSKTLKRTSAEVASAAVENASLKAQAQRSSEEIRDLKGKIAATRADTATRDSAPSVDSEVAQAMELVRARLKEPASAAFGNIRIVNGPRGKVACGTVNGRNSFGGFTGMEQFSVDFFALSEHDSGAVGINDMSSLLMWQGPCSAPG